MGGYVVVFFPPLGGAPVPRDLFLNKYPSSWFLCKFKCMGYEHLGWILPIELKKEPPGPPSKKLPREPFQKSGG